MKKILVTAFEVFGNHNTNSSMIVLEKLNNKNIDKLLLPVSYKKSREILIKYIKEKHPDFILSLGLYSQSKTIKIEKIGINYQGAKSPDNDGLFIIDNKIDENGADGLITNINTKELINHLSNDYIDVELSWIIKLYIL